VTDLVRCSCTRINDPWRRFCGGCGAQLAPACRCGFVNGRHDKFCGGCGHLVSRLDFPQSASPFSMPDTVRARPGHRPELYSALTKGTDRESMKQEPSTIPIEILDEIQ
jgi:hypothetical protein